MKNNLTAQTEAAQIFWKHHEIIRQSDKRDYLTSKEKNELAYQSSLVSLGLIIDPDYSKLVKQYLDDIPDCVYFK